MTIALFGGRFDPIHNGHILIAKEVLKVGAAEEVWFSLENQHQWRPIVASIENRRAMMELAIRSTSTALSEKFKIDETPIRLGGLTETISVVRELRKTLKDDIIFVAGSDQLPTFSKWTHWDELQKEVRFLIVARKGSPTENLPKNCMLLDDPTYEPLEDSATRIRDLIKSGKSIHGLVPEGVEKYILEYRLYK